MLPIALPENDLDRSRLLATARWHRTQAAIAKRRKSARDVKRHTAIAARIDQVVRESI